MCQMGMVGGVFFGEFLEESGFFGGVCQFGGCATEGG